MNIQLSISLLVSDRMETLDRCLASLKPLLRELDSELIIVYTGKKNETLELSKQYTSHIIPFTWCNDFSKARNAGLAQAKGEWFLYLDDDEWFEDTEEVIRFFKSGEDRQYQSAEYIQRNYLDWEGTSYSDAYVGRMCRRVRETRFIYPIHENLKPFSGPCKRFSVYVHHFGYIRTKNEEEQDMRSDRNLSLLRERIKNEPSSSHLCAQLAQEYASITKYNEAIQYCREGLELAVKEDRQDSLEMWLQYELPHLLLCAGDLKAALEEGKQILSSSRIKEVGELNLTVLLVDVCWGLRRYREGLDFVRRYQRCLEYLYRHSEKVAVQNGITISFSGAEIRAAEVYVKGLFFALELDETKAMEQILSWIPWESKAQIEAQYVNLEDWKRQHRGQREHILNAYYNLPSENIYVVLQKACYAESHNKMDEAAEFWKMCARSCPEGFEEQIIQIAVRNGFSLDEVLEQMSLEQWDRCAYMLSENLEVQKHTEFMSNVLPYLTVRPLYAERLRQAMIEKRITHGMLEPSLLTELLSEYCESVIVDTEMLYRKDIIEDENSYMLPAKYQFAVMISETLKLIESGSFAECIPTLKKALHIYPKMSVVISHLTKYIDEIMNTPSQAVTSEEFMGLGSQVKQILLGLIESGQWTEAYTVVNQLIKLLPEDLEVLRLKQEILGTGHF